VPRPDDAMGMVSRRFAPLLVVGGLALVLVPVLRLHGGGHTAKAAGTLPPATVQPVAHAVALPPARGARARTVAPAVTLPVDSPWALPPMLVLQSRTGGRASPALRRRVLGLTHLALSPAARRSVRQGNVSAGALWLLASFPRTAGPLLVLSLDGRHIRAQETTLWMTRSALRKIATMPAPQRPKRLLLEPVPTDRTDLAGPPRAKPGQLRTLVAIYRSAGYQYGIDWRVLAAINRVETNFGHNTHVSSAGAVGWMQFLPSTWRRWGVDASGDGVADPYDPQDAIFSAARYLAAAGARTDLRRAIFAYNHADWYVNEILSIAASIPANYGS
jgi:soluble lytic murein transglycosylase-like protein